MIRFNFDRRILPFTVLNDSYHTPRLILLDYRSDLCHGDACLVDFEAKTYAIGFQSFVRLKGNLWTVKRADL